MSKKTFISALLASMAALALVLSCGRMPPAAGQGLLSPSRLNADPTQYDGLEIVVRGYAHFGSHLRTLMETRKIDAEMEDRFHRGVSSKDDVNYCLTLINTGILPHDRDQVPLINNRTVTLKGRFIADYIDHVVDLGACGNPGAFLIEKVLEVE